YQNRGNEHNLLTQFQQTFSATVNIVCVICGSSYYTFRCSKLIKAIIKRRQSLKLCQNYFRANYGCYKPRKRLHHMLLHDEIKPVVPISSNNTNLTVAAHCYGLLSTVPVQFKSENLTIVICYSVRVQLESLRTKFLEEINCLLPPSLH
ncbi:hypothetical protein V1478_001614, partial [Vespula squamosa]